MVESSYTIGMKKGEKKGKIEGKLEGKIEGKIEGKKEIAINLLKAGILDLKTIADMTDLTIEEIEVLR